MKPSEFKEYIKEQILSELSGASEDDIKNQKDFNDELEKTSDLSKDLGLTESNMLNDEAYDKIDDVVDDGDWMYVYKYVGNILSFAEEDGFRRIEVLDYIYDRLHQEFL